MGKSFILVLILLLSVASVNAILMRAGDSYYSNGKNVTFMAIDAVNKIADFCVNSEKKRIFFTREGVHNIKGVRLEVFDNGVSFVKARIYVDPCQDCFCGKECTNLACYNLPIPDCVDDRECDDNRTVTNDRCLKNKCYNVASESEEERIEDIKQREEELENFVGLPEEKKRNPTFLLTIVLVVIILGVMVYFAFTRS